MIISVCIPCMNRTYALKDALPKIIRAANVSPPIQIVVLNYSSKDGLNEYIDKVKNSRLLIEENCITLAEIKNKEYYNSPHARNLSVLASTGKYFIMLSAEALPEEHAFKYIRNVLETVKPVWMCEGWSGRWIVCEKSEFVKAGGYDERFNVYAPEDREICDRLHRRGGKFVSFPSSLIGEIPTPNKEKLRYLDARLYTGNIWIKRQMHRAMMEIYNDNTKRNLLIANEETGWGKWI